MFSKTEWMIAWRYLRARRSEGGVSSIALISLIGVALGVFAMIATFAVREGFRAEYINTFLGNNAHLQIYQQWIEDESGQLSRDVADYDELAQTIGEIDGITAVEPMITQGVLVSSGHSESYAVFIGVLPEKFKGNARLVDNGRSYGELDQFRGFVPPSEGFELVALGRGLAEKLNVDIGSQIEILAAGGVQTPFGNTPRRNGYEVVFIVDSGNDFEDESRIYMPLDAAQSFANLEGRVNFLSVRVDDPESIEDWQLPIMQAIGGNYILWDWKQQNAGYLSGLQAEDNIMFILMSILVFVASFTIAAGLIMLVKNKTGDIAILRTMGFSRGQVSRIFFLAGIMLSILGTIIGVCAASLFCIYFDPIFDLVNWMIGGGAQNTTALRLVPNLTVELRAEHVIRTAILSIGIATFITYLPARAAAKLDPVEALRHG